MRVSRAQADANREAVITAASRLFREHGFDGVGLKELMKGAGLTQGGFYKQFESKSDLMSLASRRAMESATRRWSSAAASGPNALDAVLRFYLSTGHRGEIADGCPLVALGADAARQSDEIRKPFHDGIKAHLQVLEELMPGTENANSSDKAMAALALMVGAVTLSRVMTDEKMSSRMLEVAAESVKRMAASEKVS